MDVADDLRVLNQVVYEYLKNTGDEGQTEYLRLAVPSDFCPKQHITNEELRQITLDCFFHRTGKRCLRESRFTLPDEVTGAQIDSDVDDENGWDKEEIFQEDHVRGIVTADQIELEDAARRMQYLNVHEHQEPEPELALWEDQTNLELLEIHDALVPANPGTYGGTIPFDMNDRDIWGPGFEEYPNIFELEWEDD